MIVDAYIVERVQPKYMKDAPRGLELWYCHKRGYDYIPVFGSIGTKKQAEEICRQYNLDGKVHYR